MRSENRIRNVSGKPLVRIFEKIAYWRGRTLRISPLSKVRNCEFEGRCKVYDGVIMENSRIGYGTYIGWRAEIGNAKIGRFCSIAPNVKILSGSHPTHFVSSHPMFYSTFRQNGSSFVNGDRFNENPTLESGYAVEIGSDTWIGNAAIILPKVKIEVGAIIAAGSVVTKNVESYQIVAGNPAKLIRYRHKPDVCARLHASKWWESDLDWIRCHADQFLDADKFLSANFCDIEKDIVQGDLRW